VAAQLLLLLLLLLMFGVGWFLTDYSWFGPLGLFIQVRHDGADDGQERRVQLRHRSPGAPDG